MCAIGIFTVGIIGQNNNGPDIFIHHDGTQTGPAGLLGPKKPFGSINGFRRIVIMAVDAAIGSVGSPDACCDKNDIFFS